MKKILIILIFVKLGLFAGSGLSMPYGFLTSLEKDIVIKNDMVIITLDKSAGEVIVPVSAIRIMKNDYPTISNCLLIIKDYVLFGEQKVLYITKEQYEYLRRQLYNL